MNNTLVINLIGGLGSGKSTLAAGLFYHLKCLGYTCEMALEFAKDKVWEESVKTLDDQIYIFGKQFHKIWRLNGKVDIIVTDSPLFISTYYDKTDSKYFQKLVVEQFNKFNNLTYFIERGENYEENGRLQTLEESIGIDKALITLLKDNNIQYETIPQNSAIDTILNEIQKKFEKKS